LKNSAKHEASSPTQVRSLSKAIYTFPFLVTPYRDMKSLASWEIFKKLLTYIQWWLSTEEVDKF